MTPGNAEIIKCPYCGTEKELFSLASGNTCGGCQWSDTKKYYPMLRYVSEIQKCPHCGKYYFKRGNENGYGKEYCPWEFGYLSWEELKQARKQLLSENLDENKIVILNWMTIHQYNDVYNREPNQPLEENKSQNILPSEEDKSIFYSAIDALLDKQEGLVKAELLRESGRFEEALEVLDKEKTDDVFLNKLISDMKRYAMNKSTIAFIIG